MSNEGPMKRLLHRVYEGLVRPRIRKEINRQRLKLVWDIWGYWRLFSVAALSPKQRLSLLRRFLRIDWNVVHAHKPGEISEVCLRICERRARPAEVVVEAGCWQGGSSAKLSLVSGLLGYRLLIFDSFQGVEQMSPEELIAGGYNFSGEYASPETVLRLNLERYGDLSVCSIHPGWFKDTLAKRTVPGIVRVAYIDCDLASGTAEALLGVVPSLASDGWIFTQDYHIGPVRDLLSDSAFWARLGRAVPEIREFAAYLAGFRTPAASAKVAGRAGAVEANRPGSAERPGRALSPSQRGC